MKLLKDAQEVFPNGVGYNEVAKDAWGSAAKKYLNKLAKALDPHAMKLIFWNKGGVAGSGDVYLQMMLAPYKGVYVVISHPSTHGIMFRSVKSMTDHVGGPNNWYLINQFDNYEDLANHIKKLIGGHNG